MNARADILARLKRDLREVRSRFLRMQNELFLATRQLEEVEADMVKLAKDGEP